MSIAGLLNKKITISCLRFASLTYSVKASLTVASVCLSVCMVAKTAYATEYECRAGNDTRYVRVDYPGVEHLCEVSVNSGRNREVKWYADVESTFCSEKIIELVGKYQNQWGYSCEALPDHDGIDELSPRQRKYLDQIVKTNRNTQYKDQNYTLLGTRALIASVAAPAAVATTSEPNSAIDLESAAEESAAAVAGATGNLLAVQLFLGKLSLDKTTQSPELAAANADSANKPNFPDSPQVANRILLVQDDGENYQTLSRLEDLSSLIKISKEGYLLDSVIIDALYPDGHLDVSTLVMAPGDDPAAMPSCFGHQRFKQTESGLQSVTEHQVSCDL